MTEKTISKYLLNLEKNVALNNSVLLRTAQLFHQLDQLEFDLGLIDDDETTASKNSWWPIVTLIGGNSTAKAKFLNAYLGTEQSLSGVQTAQHKFTLLLHSQQPTPATLPGTAADVDPRYPFYQISQRLEQIQLGEGNRINAYLELKTVHSDRLKGQLFIDAPHVNTTTFENPAVTLLTQHSIETADLVLIFTDVFETNETQLKEFIDMVKQHQDSNKFVYLIDMPSAVNNYEVIASWQRRLNALGLHTGQFIALSSNNFAEIEQRMQNVSTDRSYRVLNTLDQSIHELADKVIPEVRQGIAKWKERTNITSLMALGFIGSLAVFAEVTMGILELLIDPIIGPIMLAGVIAIMVPLHLLASKLHGRLIAYQLSKRQKELGLLENISQLFMRSQTFWRSLLPIYEPIDWNKKTKKRLTQLTEQTKELVQALNDNFSTYNLPTNTDN